MRQYQIQVKLKHILQDDQRIKINVGIIQDYHLLKGQKMMLFSRLLHSMKKRKWNLRCISRYSEWIIKQRRFRARVLKIAVKRSVRVTCSGSLSRGHHFWIRTIFKRRKMERVQVLKVRKIVNPPFWNPKTLIRQKAFKTKVSIKTYLTWGSPKVPRKSQKLRKLWL